MHPQEVGIDTNMLNVPTRVIVTVRKESAIVSKDMKEKLVLASLVQTTALVMGRVST